MHTVIAKMVDRVGESPTLENVEGKRGRRAKRK
jgi:hypothetical protein